MDSATVIARGPGSTTIIRSDEVAARLMQGVNREKKAGSTDASDLAQSRSAAATGKSGETARAVQPVTAQPERRKGRRPEVPRKGLDALRSGVSRYQAAVSWLRAEARLYPPDLGYVALLAEDARPIQTAATVLTRLRSDMASYDMPSGAAEVPVPDILPIDVDVAPVFESAEVDITRQHLTLLRWSDSDDTLTVGHDESGLWLGLEAGVHLSLTGLDLARSITIRRGAETVTLRPDPEPPMVGLFDVVL